MKAKAEVLGQRGNRGLLELWVRRTPHRVQRVRRLVGNVLLGNSREELSHRNGEDLTTAIEDNWDGLFLKLHWRHLVLELDPLSVRPVNPTFFFEILENAGQTSCQLSADVCIPTHNCQSNHFSSSSFTFLLSGKFRNWPRVPGRHPEKCSFQAAGPWKLKNRIEGREGPWDVNRQSGHPPKSNGRLLVHFKDRMK